jgi:predicted RNA-binding protein YlxR (DUF448 family)
VTPVPAPERTCVGCRRKRAQAELVRFTLEAGRVVPAGAGARGRSAYVCPEVDCLESAEKKRAFARAFRAPVTVDPTVRGAVTRRTSDERR